ncbi:MAG: hypothetical protein FJ027_05145 [Candidatus Rokubacteria bacterium]|nr:hypothetical protein [Candidatus Rokubacteria bacterium]
MERRHGAKTISFVVRISREPSGAITGVVERVSSGVKVRFEGVAGVAPVINDLLTREDTP